MNKLIIFDCDGVLVDSEMLVHQVDVEMLLSINYSITIEESIKRFTGINENSFRQIIFEESGIQLTNDFFELKIKNLMKSFELHLNPLMKNILIELNTRKIERCVASSSPRERVLKALELTDQLKFFSDSSIFVSQQVPRGKPAPDLFLFAAKQMGYLPENCIVVEDSVPGIKAAQAAAMPVIGFFGGSHAQYDWYQQSIKAHKISIAYNVDELSAFLNHALDL